MKVTPRAVISSTSVRPVCGGGKLVQTEVESEIIISQHLAELSYRLLAPHEDSNTLFVECCDSLFRR